MYTAEIAKKTRLSTKVISAQLGKLEKYDIIESEQAGKNKIYKIKERFFNIWYLMRFGRKKDRQRVEWLVRFLESWCTKEELDERAEKLIDRITKGEVGESHVYHMVEALGYAGIDINIEDKLKKEAEKYLKDVKSNYSGNISESEKQKMGVISFLIQNRQPEKALKIIDKLNIEKEFKEKYKELAEEAIKIVEQSKVSSSMLEDINDTLAQTTDQDNIEDYLEYGSNKDIFVRYSTQMLIYIWFNKFEKSEEIFLKFFHKFYEKKEIYYETMMFFNLLIFKEQYYQAKKILENKKFNLREKYKPIWYALMTLMQDEFPHEIKKMGSELQESVDEVLKKVEEYRVKYGE
jgi:hypothetical protein